ncbi:MAG: four helix bundle protein [Methanosarcinales archaeon]
MKRFEDLKVWQKSHEFVIEVYKITQQFPMDEKFGLISQIRRSAVSIAANIAEGSKRQHLKEYIQMLYIAQGSLAETKYYLLLSRDLKYLNNIKYQELFNQSEDIGKMLSGLINSLKKLIPNT